MINHILLIIKVVDFNGQSVRWQTQILGYGPKKWETKGALGTSTKAHKNPLGKGKKVLEIAWVGWYTRSQVISLDLSAAK
jgi:hypothetical protein